MDRALSFDVAHYARHRDLRRHVQQHVHMVRHDVPLFYPALLVPRQLVECLPESSAYMPVERSTPIFRDEYDVVFALPFRMVEFLVVFHGSFVLVCFERLTNQTDRNTAL
jgi:hypothetical protein